MISDMFRRTDDILPHDDQTQAQTSPAEWVTQDQQVPTPHQVPRRFIDIHVYESEEATERVIDAFLSDEQRHDHEPDIQEQPAAQHIPHPSCVEGTPQPTRHRRRVVLVILLVACVCLVLMGVLVVLWVLPALAPSATITIVPISRVVSTTRTVTIVTGQQHSTTADQVAGRTLSQVTMSEQKTVATTGIAQQEAQAAHGTLTFYNALPAPQTIQAGQLLIGTDGVEVVTDQDAVIPAGTLATNGQISVQAHAIIVGPGGNIAARDIYGPCCRENVFVQNDAAFVGGQPAHSYQTATQKDIASVTTSIKTSLDQSTQAALQTQVENGETLLTPLDCQSQVSSDHQPGDEATQVTVTVNETCTALAYQTAALHDLMAHALTQQAATLGEGYTATGDLAIQVIQVHTNDQGTTTMQVKGSQTYGYQFSEAEQQALKNHIAGKEKEQAMTLLLHTPGVQTVSIHVDSGITMIPADTSYIHIVLVIE